MGQDGTELERLKAHQDPVYDSAALRGCYAEMVRADRQWLTWFADEGIVPLQLSYDRLCADPRAVLGQVLRGLGLDDSGADDVAVRVAKLSDKVNQDWAQRLR